MLSQGPLTLVLIYADWCGACHRFRDEVWSPLTSLQNATVNRAAVRDDMVAKTSLANVEKKFYPTLLLVGNDKKPATFPSEEGGMTNAMPRQPTLQEDLKTLTNLVNSPNVAEIAAENGLKTPEPASVANSMPTMSIKPAPEVGRSVTPGKSPFEDRAFSLRENGSYDLSTRREGDQAPPTVASLPLPTPAATATTAATVATRAALPPDSFAPSMSPPDIGSDLIASQNRAKTGTQAVLTAEPQKGGRMLRAIRRATASLRTMINLRQNHMSTRRSRHHRRSTRRNL
jgi:hypothetical protein